MPAHPDSIALGVAIAAAADDVKAVDPALFDVAEILGVVEAFVVVSATSARQLDAIVDRIEEALRAEHGERPVRREGTPASGWVLLDYGNVVVHVFLREQRAFYDLDRLFSDAAQHDPLTGDQVREMVAGAADRDANQDVELGVPGVVVMPRPDVADVADDRGGADAGGSGDHGAGAVDDADGDDADGDDAGAADDLADRA